MGLKASLIKPLAKKVSRDIKKWSDEATLHQHEILFSLIAKARKTKFGADHNFNDIHSYQDFTRAVPVRDYEELKPYIESIKGGVKDILWPGLPKYFAKTSGTTSGVKYIPITSESLPNHFMTARNTVLNYANRIKDFSFLDGKMIFLSGSPKLENVNGIQIGRLSGIVNHQIPAWLQTNKIPSYQVNCIESWEEKVDAIVKEVKGKDLRLVGGIPPWVQMFFEKILQQANASQIKEVFKNFSVLVHGGVNYEPYRQTMDQYIGKAYHLIETYPASEGFLAFQDDPDDPALLLNANSGIYFEFIRFSDIHSPSPKRYNLEEVKTDMPYSVVLNSNAGLWGYKIGDLVEFTQLDPYKVKVVGRINHFISAFGEHVIGKEVDDAMKFATDQFGYHINDYTVAPQVNPPEGGLPYHEWFVELDNPIKDISSFASLLDQRIQEQNIYYRDLVTGKILRPLEIRIVRKNTFREYMKSIGKLGEQNKLPRLKNDRSIADSLAQYIVP